ncbi:MAG: methyltransferase domain-containing protein [Solirubrobacterales bacterium]|nr:methyltransferase domain-containing protein [Solirubrobacterales bacterium]
MELSEHIKEISWYHTIELAPGVVTPGTFDLRDQIDGYGLPERLDGMRALDIGTQNGFWAFEMERRGAAEVVALDLDDERELDWPPRRRAEIGEHMRDEGLRLARGKAGFELAKEALGSKVERVTSSVYTARASELGTFDLVFCGSVLMHLRDQLLALERIAQLCSGTFISAEEYDRRSALAPFPVSRYLADRPSAVVFWLPSARTWRRMIWTAGFDQVAEHRRFTLEARDFSVRHVVHHASDAHPGVR